MAHYNLGKSLLRDRGKMSRRVPIYRKAVPYGGIRRSALYTLRVFSL